MVLRRFCSRAQGSLDMEVGNSKYTATRPSDGFTVEAAVNTARQVAEEEHHKTGRVLEGFYNGLYNKGF